MPTTTVIILPEQEEEMERLKKGWGLRSNTDVCMKIIKDFLESQKEKKPTK